MTETMETLAARTAGRLVGDPEVVISDVVHDHREGGAGAMFVARRGLTVDGHDFVAEAATTCAGVCVEDEVAGIAVPQLVVEDSRHALGVLASAVHGDPFSALRAVGVTGTNGKTMVTHLLGSIVAHSGRIPAVAGTLGWSIGDDRFPLARTSPEASDLYRMAAAMVSAGVDVAAFEVSSHALSLDRVSGATFAVAAFTNLSRDHLDFHPDMESYFEAKASLFDPAHTAHAVIWIDDPWGARLAASLSMPLTSVGASADVSVDALAATADGTGFDLMSGADKGRVNLPLAGRFNVSNAAIAAACALHLEIPFDAVVAGLEGATAVPGRFETISVGSQFRVVVDYAHTPDGIEHAVAAARDLTDCRVLVVTGAGGDRDPTKRSEMGKAASRGDVVIVTSDNPRSEDPAVIAGQIMEGVGDHPAAVVEIDRRTAIRNALTEAQPGDFVLILGKGHEQGQEFADRTDPFDDAAVIREEAAAL
ncbi:MAG: UDP-N-acetylmuramoyl-L-alanyl-D-glutamate--2,6-diaminopimelate ligase [Acidimicrobiia bacterium]|nr:UDP-N-acetylmuramoyl-L-alanyl-D-glutamate--2,6-diaminopimelate ligase [Acidimicrobiia bacterium]